MAYGIKIKDLSVLNIITPDTGTLISSGTLTMPNSLNGDGTYYTEIDLPGEDPIPISRLAVFLQPHGNLHYEAWVKYYYWDVSPDDVYQPNAFLNAGDYTYYTVDAYGVYTLYTPGDRTLSDPSKWEGIFGIMPIYGWDVPDVVVTTVRLYALTCYLVQSGMTTLNFKPIYSIGNTGGIEKIDYAIFLKRWNY